ncbi:hypothetical protein NUM3379_29370 [Kineococcus sp. NUM-3379]
MSAVHTAPASLPARRSLLLAGALSAAAGLVAPRTAAAAAVPLPVRLPALPGHLPGALDDLGHHEGPVACGPVQPGTQALARLITATYGRQTIGTARACPVNGVPTSEHHEGRALDWALDVADPVQLVLAETFLAWLLAPDAAGRPAAVARRLGVMYVIWNHRVWKSYRADAGWQPYTGSNPHTDHIHISLTRRGGRAETSWWTGAASPVAGHWVRLGAERSHLGLPVSAERSFRGGLRQDFRGGSILHSRATLAHEVRGAIAGCYFSGDHAAALGMPTTGELPTPRRFGRYNHFQAGSIYWSPTTGAHAVRGAIRDAWARQGWETGPLGFPTSSEHEVPGGRRSHFEGGSLVFTWADGQVVTVPR